MHSYHQMAQDVKHWAFKAGRCYNNQLQLPASRLKLDCRVGGKRAGGGGDEEDWEQEEKSRAFGDQLLMPARRDRVSSALPALAKTTEPII